MLNPDDVLAELGLHSHLKRKTLEPNGDDPEETLASFCAFKHIKKHTTGKTAKKPHFHALTSALLAKQPKKYKSFSQVFAQFHNTEVSVLEDHPDTEDLSLPLSSLILLDKQQQAWMRFRAEATREQNGFHVAIVVGPTGCGKTMFVQSLCKHLAMPVQSWTCMAQQTYGYDALASEIVQACYTPLGDAHGIILVDDAHEFENPKEVMSRLHAHVVLTRKHASGRTIAGLIPSNAHKQKQKYRKQVQDKTTKQRLRLEHMSKSHPVRRAVNALVIVVQRMEQAEPWFVPTHAENHYIVFEPDATPRMKILLQSHYQQDAELQPWVNTLGGESALLNMVHPGDIRQFVRVLKYRDVGMIGTQHTSTHDAIQALAYPKKMLHRTRHDDSLDLFEDHNLLLTQLHDMYLPTSNVTHGSHMIPMIATADAFSCLDSADYAILQGEEIIVQSVAHRCKPSYRKNMRPKKTYTYKPAQLSMCVRKMLPKTMIPFFTGDMQHILQCFCQKYMAPQGWTLDTFHPRIPEQDKIDLVRTWTKALFPEGTPHTLRWEDILIILNINLTVQRTFAPVS